LTTAQLLIALAVFDIYRFNTRDEHAFSMAAILVLSVVAMPVLTLGGIVYVGAAETRLRSLLAAQGYPSRPSNALPV
jgi:uncharacterized membrane protein